MFPALLISAVLLSSPSNEWVDTARAGWSSALAQYSAGVVTVEDVCRWSARVYAAEHQADPSNAPLLAHIARLKSLEESTAKRVAAGAASPLATLTVKAERFEAEAQLGGGTTSSKPAANDGAEALYRDGKFAEACPLFAKRADVTPANPAAWNDLAICLFRVEDLRDAVAASVHALALDDLKERDKACFNLAKFAPKDAQTQRYCDGGQARRR